LAQEVDEKLRKAFEMQKRLEEKLKNIPSLNKKAERYVPPPLIVDNNNNQVDAQGNIILPPTRLRDIATLRVNRQLEIDAPHIDNKNPYFDPRVSTDRLVRPHRGFEFVEEGTYIRKAERIRARTAKYHIKQQKIQESKESEDSASFESQAMDVGSPTQPGSTPVFRTRYKIDFVPIVEW